MIGINNVCNGMMYTIKEGDTLYKISRMNNIPLGELLAANADINIYNLQVGDTICIPRKEEATVLPNISGGKWFVYIIKDEDTLESILESFDIDLEELIEANRQNRIMLKPGSVVVVPEK